MLKQLVALPIVRDVSGGDNRQAPYRGGVTLGKPIGSPPGDIDSLAARHQSSIEVARAIKHVREISQHPCFEFESGPGTMGEIDR
ncbi:MAG TPA: hypothetical protein VIJ35_12580, partial [Bradyrhizobium sp.]